MSRLDKVSSCASNSCVAQRQSIRLLIGRLLVRIQSQEPAPRRQSLRGFCLSTWAFPHQTPLLQASHSAPSGALRRPSAAATIRGDDTTWASLAPPPPHPAPAWRRRVRPAPSSSPKQNPACHPKRAGKRGLSALDGAGGVNHGPPRAGNRNAVNQLGTNALGECSRQT